MATESTSRSSLLGSKHYDDDIGPRGGVLRRFQVIFHIVSILALVGVVAISIVIVVQCEPATAKASKTSSTSQALDQFATASECLSAGGVGSVDPEKAPERNSQPTGGLGYLQMLTDFLQNAKRNPVTVLFAALMGAVYGIVDYQKKNRQARQLINETLKNEHIVNPDEFADLDSSLLKKEK